MVYRVNALPKEIACLTGIVSRLGQWDVGKGTEPGFSAPAIEPVSEEPGPRAGRSDLQSEPGDTADSMKSWTGQPLDLKGTKLSCALWQL